MTTSENANPNLRPLDKDLRGKLENAVKAARKIAEEAALSACEQLGVGRAKPDDHLSEDEKDLRRRLRIHGRQLGDERHAEKKTQSTERLVEEIAYEHWHRMLFARFLAENGLLMYPDPDDPVAVSIDDCNDLAADEGASNGWELAARFASKMLPQIFRLDSPVFALTLPPEKQQQLEKLLGGLDHQVFAASDSLGWVYQFWQADAKKRINESEVKIGARELPAVTQLFTEPYMVSFLLDNSLGAWWAARRLSQEDLRTPESEQELREKASLPGVPLEYLRFVRTDPASFQTPTDEPEFTLDSGSPRPASGREIEGEAPSLTGPWTPAAGTFDAWPQSLAELKTLDPCCGSGHFLVAALLMLVPMRMELEDLSACEAVDRVIAENLHGLEIDQRCVELAAFALALAAWRFPDAGGYRVLPDLNVACCGLSVSVPKEEWKALAGDDKQLRIALDWMYDEFKDAPVLGSLLNPAKSMAATVVKWEELSPIIEQALKTELQEETREAAIVAQGLLKSSSLLSKSYSLIVTNVPYLATGKQHSVIRRHCDSHFPTSRYDLATVFIERCVELGGRSTCIGVVTSQTWLFLGRYKKLREKLLNNQSWRSLVRLGEGGFDSSAAAGAFTALLLLTNHESEQQTCAGIDATNPPSAIEKSTAIRSSEIIWIKQAEQLSNPNCVISLHEIERQPLLSTFATALAGCYAGDGTRFVRSMWEVVVPHTDWELHQTTVIDACHFGGKTEIVFWQQQVGDMFELAQSVKHLNHAAQNWLRGKPNWAKPGVVVSQMRSLPPTLYTGAIYDCNACAIVPNNKEDVPALWAYCQ